MRPGLAGRLSRALVGWHPRRWRERYREEMLEVLDQHHPTARTVASLAGQRASARTLTRPTGPNGFRWPGCAGPP